MPAPHTYTAPSIGKGYALQYKLPPAVTFATAGWMVNIDTDYGVGSVEWTNLGSTAVRRMPTIPDNGPLTGTIQFLSNEQTNLDMQNLLTSPQIIQWQVLGTDTSTQAFLGFVTKYSPSYSNGDINQADFEVTVDGPVVFTAGT